MKNILDSITDVPGIRVGHAHNFEALTGCSVILCPRGTVGGVDQRGGAPATRETDLLKPMHLVNEIHAVLLTGGSAFGLDAASGVMKFLEETGTGYDTGVARVPIVSGAAIYDLDIGSPNIRPDSKMGYQACLHANHKNQEQGNVGAGIGARVGSLLGIGSAMKSGIGTASIQINPGLFVGALFVVNAFGDVLDRDTGEIIAGTRSRSVLGASIGKNDYFADTLETMRTKIGSGILKFAGGQNTIIGVVATNAKLNKESINKVAQMAHNGIAKTIRPAHTLFDGDTIFALSTNKRKADINLIGAFAAEVTSQAINNAVLAAKPAGGLPSARHKFLLE